MTNVADLYAHVLAIAEGKAEFAQEVIDILDTPEMSDEDKLQLLRLFAKKTVLHYERLSNA